eukprot:818064-Rhodomonas_salina.1
MLNAFALRRWELHPASLLITDPELDQRLIHLAAEDPIVSEVLSFARDEYSNTGMVSPSQILQAVLWTPFDGRKVALCRRTQADGCAALAGDSEVK